MDEVELKIFLEKYEPHEQALLLLTKREMDKNEQNYVKSILLSPEFDWEKFVGSTIWHKVNGVVYNRVKKLGISSNIIQLSLKLLFAAQAVRSKQQQQEIMRISKILEVEKIKYAFLKGSILNKIVYEDGERVSNDIDILTSKKDSNVLIKAMQKDGYLQGKYDYKDKKIIEATREEKLFAVLNTYETVPLIKKEKCENDFLEFQELDVNFRLSDLDKTLIVSEMLDKTQLIEYGESENVRTLSLEVFLIFQCIHLFREANMVVKIVGGHDLDLYKFMDIHFLITKYLNKIDWIKLFEYVRTWDCLNEVFYALYYTEKLYPHTISKKILEENTPDNIEFLNQYFGNENSTIFYDWNENFEGRVFNYNRKSEALKNLKYESERFEENKKNLKNGK